eukprot:maker-scaffold370_size193435-snap-gene-0.40 protein:Tk07792 transcript:maker-scaffold370_size193435-snap-gene-0.40-mRNA-1 annotation:"hypothetical protein DAPPUDRAFT_320790"
MWNKFPALREASARRMASNVAKQCLLHYQDGHYGNNRSAEGSSSGPNQIDSTKAQQILNDIVNFGIDQSDRLEQVRERQLFEEGINLQKSNPAHFVGVFNKQKKQARPLATIGYASLQASSLLARQFRLTRQQVVYGLERVELRSTDLFRRCPFGDGPQPRQDRCRGLDLLYRSADGSCNNLLKPEWGSSFSPSLRFLPPVYSDTVGLRGEFRLPKRVRRNNRILPSARAVSTAIHKKLDTDTLTFTMMVMQWGQFLDHDLTFTPMRRGFQNSLIRCCTDDGKPLPENLMHEECRPIEVPTTDPFFSQFNVTCMEFVRSLAAPKRDCSLGPRDQMNQVTSFIDASNVYGSTQEEQDRLRLLRNGKLRYTDLHIRKPLLPPLDQEIAQEECRISTPNLHCFEAGDERVNEQPGLTSMHTMWLREHNRLARELQKENPHWEDERIYHETRKIVGAMHQHITFNEWLPIVLGPRVLSIFELTLKPTGFFDGYNNTVNPTVANAFGGAAFRFGHSLVKGNLSRHNKEFREVPFYVKLRKELNNPANLHNFGSVDRITLGLCSKALSRRDEFITDELTNHLFQNPRTKYGMDLASLNIQRGRDHGLPPYNKWREQCGLEKFKEFSDMAKFMRPETVIGFQSVYDSVDDIDLFPGGLAELPVVGGLVGPTFACILGQQFLNLRKGDRFWYENGEDANPGGAFSAQQLQEIRKTSLARTICDNLDDIEMIQPYAFLTVDSFHNQRTACRGTGIPKLDTSAWREDPDLSQPALLSAMSNLLRSQPSGLGPIVSSEEDLPYRHKFGNLYEYNSQKDGSSYHDQDSFIQHPQVDDGVEPKIIYQSKMPKFRENTPFTTEVPRQLSRDQYYNFFNNEIGLDIADPGSEKDQHSYHASAGTKSRTGKKKGGFQKTPQDTDPTTKAELQRMFESLLKDVNELNLTSARGHPRSDARFSSFKVADAQIRLSDGIPVISDRSTHEILTSARGHPRSDARFSSFKVADAQIRLSDGIPVISDKSTHEILSEILLLATKRIRLLLPLPPRKMEPWNTSPAISPASSSLETPKRERQTRAKSARDQDGDGCS